MPCDSKATPFEITRTYFYKNSALVPNEGLAVENCDLL